MSGAYIFDVAGKWKSLVASKSPHLARGSSDTANGADQRQQEHDDSHDRGSRIGSSSVIQDLDNRDSRRRIQQVVDVSGAEAKRDEHGQAQDRIEECGPDHS